MKKLVLISILIAPLVIGMRAAKSRTPYQGLRRAVVATIAFNAVYLIVLVFFQGWLF